MSSESEVAQLQDDTDFLPYLEGYVAVELAGLEGQMCGRILADMGMDVIKVESPAGDPVRRLSPRVDEQSLRFTFLNSGKKSVVIDRSADEGRRSLRSLVDLADVFLTSLSRRELEAWDLDLEALRRERPGLVVVTVTGFGRDGPYGDAAFSDLVGMAMGGLMYVSGDPELPPLTAPETQAAYFASVFAAHGTTLALYRRERDEQGRGALVDVTAHQALASIEQLIRIYGRQGRISVRTGSQHRHVAPARVFPTADGYVSLFVTNQHWQPFLDLWPDHPSELDDPALKATQERMARLEMINQHVRSFTLRHTTAEFVSLMGEGGVPSTPVNSLGEFLSDAQTKERELLLSVAHPGLEPLSQVSFPPLMDGVRIRPKPAPALGQHTDKVMAGLTSSNERGPDLVSSHEGRTRLMRPALSDVRVVEFTTALAGPLSCRHLAEAGAEVIKVESGGRGLDSFRIFSPDGDLDGSPRFFESNLGVLSVRMNLRTEEGLELAKDLVKQSDVVVDNFRPDVLERLGLGVSVLRELNPRLVVVKLPGFGSSGPRKTQGTWGPNLLAHTGMTYLWNHPDQGEPIGTQSVYPDYVAAAFTPSLISAALIRREKTGLGTYIDLAQAELMAYMLGTLALEWAATGVDPEPMGNGSRDFSPHGCYPCQGEDRWIVIVVETDHQWRALADLIGHPELAMDHRFATTRRRLEHLADVDNLVGKYTENHEAFELMATLRELGIAAGVVQNAEDLWSDPQLAWRSATTAVHHPVLGSIVVPVLPIHLSDGGTVEPTSSPLLGEHDEQIICGLLGRSPQELERLREDGVVA